MVYTGRGLDILLYRVEHGGEEQLTAVAAGVGYVHVGEECEDGDGAHAVDMEAELAADAQPPTKRTKTESDDPIDGGEEADEEHEISAAGSAIVKAASTRALGKAVAAPAPAPAVAKGPADGEEEFLPAGRAKRASTRAGAKVAPAPAPTGNDEDEEQISAAVAGRGEPRSSRSVAKGAAAPASAPAGGKRCGHCRVVGHRINKCPVSCKELGHDVKSCSQGFM